MDSPNGEDEGVSMLVCRLAYALHVSRIIGPRLLDRLGKRNDLCTR